MVSTWLIIIVGLVAWIWTFIDVAKTKGKIYGSVQATYPLYKPTAYIVAPFGSAIFVMLLARFLLWILYLFGIVL